MLPLPSPAEKEIAYSLTGTVTVILPESASALFLCSALTAMARMRVISVVSVTGEA